MKKMISVVLISVFGFSGNLCALVQKAPLRVAVDRIEVFEGSVVSVNEADREVIVKDLNNEEVTVTVDAATKISRSGKPANLSKLRKGKNVTVHCRVSGTDVIAEEIRYV